MTIRYQQSEIMLNRALNVIPLGSQTFSKSLVQFPLGAAPFFIEKGKGARVWDVDGNVYIDFVNGLLAILLGYKDEDVDRDVRQQLANGVSFSLPHRLETEVAEEIIAMVPCAEMVRFAKNGSDATAGAIRLARAYTGKEHVAVCGYHGWQDWYIGSTPRHLGVPEAVRELTHTFTYNDIESLKKIFKAYPNQIAAVIMEPMSFDFPASGFLQSIQQLCHDNKAVFIFDETITGFRFAQGGAQELFGITPDLVTLGKGIANGYPLSVIAGRADIMKMMDEIFFSFTFGGETLSLAAALAVINKIKNQPILHHIHKTGEYLLENLKKLIVTHQLESCLSIKGHPCWSLITFHDYHHNSSWQIKTFWIQEILKRGILSFGSHNLSYAHQKDDIDQLLNVYDQVFYLLKKSIENDNLLANIEGEILQPLFKVRDCA